jgi:hypothetical protein
MMGPEQATPREIERSLAAVRAALEALPTRPEQRWPEVWARVQAQTTQQAARRRTTWQSFVGASALALMLFASGAWSSLTAHPLATNAPADVVSAPLFVASATATARPSLAALATTATGLAHTPKYVRPALTPIPAPPN